MGALCSCFISQSEEFTVRSSTGRNMRHHNNASRNTSARRVLSFFNRYILRPMGAPSESAPQSTFSKEATLGTSEILAMYSSSSEENCPTCFERYSEENPKITTSCSHHFHLPCIYEWRERSELCPYCRQVLVIHDHEH